MKHRIVVLALLAGSPLRAQTTPAVSGIEYQLSFTRATAARRAVEVITRLEVAAAGSLRLSLPAWTPGAYEISNFAKHLSGFQALAGSTDLVWDKVDYDTWRVQVPRPGPVTVRFTFTADVLDNAAAWAKSDFLFVNGTNVFLYPEDSDLGFPATVVVKTEADWSVATGMTAAEPGRYRAASYHDAVDMPFFVGRFDLDSVLVERKWHHLASYPAGAFAGQPRKLLLSQIERAVPVMVKVFGEAPWSHYTTMLVFDGEFGGGSALEHQNSHLGIYNPGFIGTPILASITAHEIFHAWNVKRMRPSEMVPYRYDRPQPTTLLWVSEGITDYYADLALVRGGVIDSTTFIDLTLEKIREVAATPPVALEDASLSTWIQPTDGTATIYYPKGSLVGWLLDIAIRDATDNKASLDEVMRRLYRKTSQTGRGFTDRDWWATVAEVSGRGDFADFATRYIDGREPLPYGAYAPQAGLRFVADSIREPRIGIGTTTSESGTQLVTNVVAGSPAAEAGINLGDQLISVGEITADANFGAAYRARYRAREGERIPVVVTRGGATVKLTLTVRHAVRVEERLEFDRRAILKPARIRAGILHGTTER